MINYNGVNTNVDEILDEQGYSIETVEARIRDYILDSDKFFNIYYAIEGDFSDSRSNKIVDDFIKEFISDFIIDKLQFKSEYDYIDFVDEIINENFSEFDSLNEELSSYGDKQLKSWKDDKDDLNAYYYRTRI